MNKFSQTIILALFLIFAASCGNNGHIEHRDMPNTDRITKLIAHDSLKVPDLRQVWHWKLLAESKIAIFNPMQTSGIIGVYDLKSMDSLSSFGIVGRGPGEFVAPMWGAVQDDDKIALYDMMNKKYFEFKLTDTIFHAQREHALAGMQGEDLAPPYQIIMEASNGNYIYHAEMPDPTGTTIEVRNPSGENLLGSTQTELKTGVAYDCYVFMCELNNRLFTFFKNLNRLEIFRLDDSGKITPYLTIGDNRAKEIASNVNNEKAFYCDATTDGKYVFALKNMPNYSRQIVEKWNHEGNLIEIFEFDRTIDKILIDPISNTLYCHSPALENETIFLYNLH